MISERSSNPRHVSASDNPMRQVQEDQLDGACFLSFPEICVEGETVDTFAAQLNQTAGMLHHEDDMSDENARAMLARPGPARCMRV